MNITITDLYLTPQNADLHLRHNTVAATSEHWWLIGEGNERGVLVMSKGSQNSDPLVISILSPAEAVRAFRLITRPDEGWRLVKASPDTRIALYQWHEDFPPKPGDDDEKVTTLPLTGKFVYFVMETEHDANGFIPCIALDDEAGYYRTTWRWKVARLKEAEELCDEMNTKLGISKKEAMLIQLRSMR